MEIFVRFTRSPVAVAGLLLLVVIIGLAIFADVLYPGDPLALAGRPLQWPSLTGKFLLGTDLSGRNIAAEIAHGARVTLIMGMTSTIIALTLGIVVGAFAGFNGGMIDELLMRLTEAFQTLPSFILLLVLVLIFGSSMTTVIIAVAIVSWPPVARLTRAEFLTLRNREFVQACHSIGLTRPWIMFREVLPNALPPIIVYASVVMATAILLESALAFLELSDPNVASWGNLIGQGRKVLRSEWYVSAIPGVSIVLTILSVSLFGQGLNDALNPRLHRR